MVRRRHEHHRQGARPLTGFSSGRPGRPLPDRRLSAVPAAFVAAMLSGAAAAAWAAGDGPNGGGAGPAYLDGPPPGHTGGFGEPSCHRCHFDRPPDPPGGALEVEGIPERYRPDSAYRIRVAVAAAELGRGGFQLSARCSSPGRRGQQAGRLEAPGRDAEVIEGTGEEYEGSAGVQYAQQSAGAGPSADDTVSWSVRWRAPRAGDTGGGTGETRAPTEDCGEVAVHVAANAANGDDSEFGDRIYTDVFRVRLSGPSGSGSGAVPGEEREP